VWSSAYFNPKANQYIAFHRQLFILSCKNPLQLLVNLIGLLRWVGCNAWILSFKACRRLTKEELTEYQVGRTRLFLTLLQLALCHMIPPGYYFKYKGYHKENKKKFMEYIYNQEMSYVHQYCNKGFSNYRAAVQLIGDKYNFSRVLHKAGLPTVVGKLHSTLILKKNEFLLFQKKNLFCKPNNGSRSKDAFHLNYDTKTDSYELKTIYGKHLTIMTEIKAYLKDVCFRNKHLLIQPFLRDHQEMKALSTQSAATTVRVITEKKHSSHCIPNVLYLQLEIPKEIIIESKNIPRQFYTVLPLDIHSLDINAVFKKKYPDLEEQSCLISNALKILLRDAINYCILAHQQLINLRTVAFDLIISEQGPVILEANYNWGIEMLYLVIDLDQGITESNNPAAQWINALIGEHKPIK
jgi:hypothetical protein